jgi:hypothetical protein
VAGRLRTPPPWLGGTQLSTEDAAKWRERLLERAGKELQPTTREARLGTVFDKCASSARRWWHHHRPACRTGRIISGERFDKRARWPWSTEVQRMRAPARRPSTLARSATA